MGIVAMELSVLCQPVRPAKGRLGSGRGPGSAGARRKHSTRDVSKNVGWKSESC